ncbi:MAG: DUF3473 domain-containing protein [Gemmatimonadales bacterium]
MTNRSTDRAKTHVLTVSLEDYFQVGAFNRLIQHGQWYRFETGVERGARHTLDLLDEFGIKATFFVSGWIAERAPGVVREVAARGHEVASAGYHHRSIRELSPAEFKADLARSRELLAAASGQPIVGYRAPRGWFGPDDLWALDVLADEGYAYDSSVGLLFRRFAAEPWRRFVHPHRVGERTLWELPPSAVTAFGWSLPIAGGNYFRQLPHGWIRRRVASWDRRQSAPFVMYFHTWELDREQPTITGAPLLQRLRQYRNLSRMPERLRYFFDRYRFQGAAEYLGVPIAAESVPVLAEAPAAIVTAPAARPRRGRTPISIVVPCFQEEAALPYLANTLARVEASLAEDYEVRLVFVDDASRDRTWDVLGRLFGDRHDATLVRHDRNRGIAAAIGTGLRAATTEIVCSIDCDCSYDPHELRRMVPLLTPGVDLVTASPYHPEGTVSNVPGWRLALSRTLSVLYRLVLRQKLSTYTSCFRVYRRSAAAPIEVGHGGFLGIAELLGRLDLRGSTIVEHPARLEVRVLGRSKMKIVRTIAGHLGLLAELWVERLAGPRRRLGPPAPTARSL